MGLFGLPSEISALQSTQAQGVASKAKAAERAAAERTSRRDDAVEFKVAGMEDGAAIRKADEDSNEEEEGKGRGEEPRPERPQESRGNEEGGLDLTA
jgi:hypothetical protein